ncbi:MAG TPA: hypothetical protein PKA38_00120 [Candidatus Levybacteria bacterium]|nr:hypothetical protein [Candidatus Levybacteria bacterium]
MMDAIAFWMMIIVLGTMSAWFVNLGGRKSIAGFFLLTFVILIAYSAIGHDLRVDAIMIVIILTGTLSILLGVLITSLSEHAVLDVIGLLFFTVGIVVLLDESMIGDPLIRELQGLKTVSEMRNAN